MIFKINKRETYAIIDKRIFSADMTWKAKGILCYLLSHSDGWEVRIDDLVQQSKEGKTAVKSAMKELREHGYAELKAIRNDQGKVVGRKYDIYEDPSHRKLGFPTIGKTDDRKTYPIKSISKDIQEDSAFATFWDSYDYKKDRSKAEKAWNRLTAAEKKSAQDCVGMYVSETTVEEITGSGWKPRRKYPATWINAKGWQEYTEKAEQRKADEETPTQYDAAYRKYLDWASENYPRTAANVKYLSKRQFIEYNENDLRMTDGARFTILRRAHNDVEQTGASIEVFGVYQKMADTQRQQTQTI